MSLNHLYLRAFYAVASERSFTRAAQVLRISQSTLSAQVKALEERSGLRLLDRKRGIALTAAGEDVFGRCHELFRIHDEIESLLERGRELTEGRLKIGTDGPSHIVPVIQRFTTLHPNVAVSLATGNARHVLKQLLDRETDVALVAMAKGQDSRLVMTPFCTYRLLAYVSRDHPWAGREAVDLADFDGQRLVVREPSSMTRQMLRRALARARSYPSAQIEFDSREAAREAVAMGIGIGVMGAREYLVHDTRTVPIRIDTPDLHVTEYVACLPERSRMRAVREFVRLCAEFADPPEGAGRATCVTR